MNKPNRSLIKKILAIKIEIHSITIIYFLIALFAGYFKQYLIIFSIVLFHEYFHAFMACIYNFNINKIKLLPFGAFLELNDFGTRHVLSEMMVIIAGPLSHVFTHIIIYLLYKYNLISFISYQYIININKFVLLFNLLPIYPLDGAKLINLGLSFIIPYKKSLYATLLISIISFLLFVKYQPLYFGNFSIYIYLLFSIFLFFKTIPLIYQRLLLKRLYHCEYNKVKINRTDEIYRPFYNLFTFNKQLLSEKDYLQHFFAKKRQ